MSHYVRQVRQYDNLSGNGRVQTTEVQAHSDAEFVSNHTVAEQIVSYIVGIVEVILAVRLVLAMLGANPANGFVSFMYSLTHPFIAPFEGIFGSQQLGVSHFESATLVAMIIYALIGWGINSAIRLGQRGTGEVDL